MGIKTLNDISKMLPQARLENGYYVVTVQNPQEVAETVDSIVKQGGKIVL